MSHLFVPNDGAAASGVSHTVGDLIQSFDGTRASTDCEGSHNPRSEARRDETTAPPTKTPREVDGAKEDDCQQDDGAIQNIAERAKSQLAHPDPDDDCNTDQGTKPSGKGASKNIAPRVDEVVQKPQTIADATGNTETGTLAPERGDIMGDEAQQLLLGSLADGHASGESPYQPLGSSLPMRDRYHQPAPGPSYHSQQPSAHYPLNGLTRAMSLDAAHSTSSSSTMGIVSGHNSHGFSRAIIFRVN